MEPDQDTTLEPEHSALHDYWEAVEYIVEWATTDGEHRQAIVIQHPLPLDCAA